MKIKNTTSKILWFCGKSILPGEVIAAADTAVNDPTYPFLVAHGMIATVEEKGVSEASASAESETGERAVRTTRSKKAE